MPDNDIEQQFLHAYDNYHDAIERYCYYRVFDREKAKDHAQEAYSRTWKYMATGQKVDNIRAFLYRLARNIIIDESRKKKNTSLDLMMENGFVPGIDERQKTQDYFTGKELVVIVKSLDEKYKDVILMKYVDDLSTKEIAFALDETENNVYVKLSRGLEMVRKIAKRQEA